MLKQNTPEWLQARKDKIGASDAPVIMQASPYKTPFQLWQEKLDLIPNQITTQAMQRGHDLEDRARQELEKMTGIFFLPQVKFHVNIPYMMASLDAIDPEGRHIAEIKCANEEDHSIAISGKVPGKYFPQLQHQLEVCELDSGYYFSFDGIAGVLVTVYRDDKYIKRMLDKEKKFFECMQDFVAPDLSPRDYVERSDPEWLEIATQWQSIKDKISSLELEEDQARQKLIAMTNNQNVAGGGIRVSKLVRKGTVEYAKIPELKTVNLDSYRKSPVEYWKIISA